MPKQQARREAPSTGRCLRATPHVDYLRAGRGFIHDSSSDEDYVDDPLVTGEDIVNEDADMEGLENEACDDARKVNTLPDRRDTGVAAGDKDSASGEKSVAAGEKDVATGMKDVAACEKNVAACEKDVAAVLRQGEKDDATREKTVAANTKATAAEPADNNALTDTVEKGVAKWKVTVDPDSETNL
ncbi:hypothetical protein PInf_018465 [Phytophthora infestans]|nr:hypothetical protein PInf_018465 [Phytophthora infestans]